MKTFVILTILLSNISIHAAGIAKLGKGKYKSICATCHGKKGEGSQEKKAPSLKGQHDWYLTWAIKSYQKGGTRTNKDMAVMVKSLKSQDIANLVAYIKTFE